MKWRKGGVHGGKKEGKETEGWWDSEHWMKEDRGKRGQRDDDDGERMKGGRRIAGKDTSR